MKKVDLMKRPKKSNWKEEMNFIRVASLVYTFLILFKISRINWKFIRCKRSSKFYIDVFKDVSWKYGFFLVADKWRMGLNFAYGLLPKIFRIFKYYIGFFIINLIINLKSKSWKNSYRQTVQYFGLYYLNCNYLSSQFYSVFQSSSLLWIEKINK